jgi:HKD family nuclease
VEPEKVRDFTVSNKFVNLSLTQNFRSLQPIVDLSSKLVAQPTITGRYYNKDSPVCLALLYNKSKIQELATGFVKFLESCH